MEPLRTPLVILPMFPRFFVKLIGLVLLLGGVSMAIAAERFATVYKVHGSIVATNPETNVRRELKPGDVLLVGEQVLASSTGEAVLRTDDAGVIAVRPNSFFAMERFTASGGREDRFSLRIFIGALRLITGLIGVRNKENYAVFTPTAIIGIRGTDYEPYVLVDAVAQILHQPEGTYNKVNRGATVIEAGGGQIDVDAGRVGFAPAKADTRDSRGLLTALLPVLLQRVPKFYVPGMFDGELEEYAARELAQAQKSDSSKVLPATAPEPTASAVTPSVPPAQALKPGVVSTPDSAHCSASGIAGQWLADMDQAIVRRDPQAFVDKFAVSAKIAAQVRTSEGKVSEIKFTRDELARSTFRSLGQLTEFSTSRPSTTVTYKPQNFACKRMEVESVVIERGVRSGQSYRLESIENFTLVLQAGKWLAVQASARQR